MALEQHTIGLILDYDQIALSSGAEQIRNRLILGLCPKCVEETLSNNRFGKISETDPSARSKPLAFTQSVKYKKLRSYL